MKYTVETALRNFEFWSGARENANQLTTSELKTMIEKIEKLQNVRIYYNKRNALKPQYFTPERQKELYDYIVKSRNPSKLFSVYLDANGYRTSNSHNYWQTAATATKTETKATKAATKTAATTTKTAAVEIIEYSEKAFAIIGDTKPLRNRLKELGAKFNPHLTCGAGWVLSKNNRNKETLKLSLSI